MVDIIKLCRYSFLLFALLPQLGSAGLGELVPQPVEEDSGEDEDVEFNDQFLVNANNNEKVDVSRFSRGNPVLPGIYSVSIYVNDSPRYNGKVTFKGNNTNIASACINKSLITQLAFDTSKATLVNDNESTVDESYCYDLNELYPGAKVKFDSAEQRIDISLPQAYVLSRPAGYVDPSLWESGINAGMLSYDFNAYSSSSNDNDTMQSAYAGLNYGINLGAWRFRSRGTANWSSDNGTEYNNQDMYVQRDITSLKSQLVLGDTYTSGDTFDSINLRGLRLYSDDRMLPGASSGYAPVVRGVANSNAKITIKQSGNTIYETTVPPGPFIIDDLNPTGYGSDLEVTVEEADGSKRSFAVPFSSVTQLLRPGNFRWDFGIGELNDDSASNKPKIINASGYYGFSNLFTGYAGIELTDMDYSAALIGVAVNTPIGAWAIDITQSQAEIDTLGTLRGQSYRISYSKLMELTDTSFNVAAYRFSTQNYLSLTDANALHDEIEDNSNDQSKERAWQYYDRQKNQIQVNINQPLRIEEEDYGSVYLTGSWEDYWGSDKTTSQYSFGYSNFFRWGSYNISLQRVYNENDEQDDRAYVSISIPLDNLFGNNDIRKGGFNNLNSSLSTDFKGNSQADMSAGGNSSDNRYSYSVNASTSLSESQDLTQFGGYGSYNSAYGPMSVSASVTSDGGRQLSFGNSGGVVIHAGGITPSPGSIGTTSTIALVKAKGARGARMTNGDGEIDSRGYAVMPYLSPYSINTVGLNTDTLENDVAIMNTSTTAIPRDGAVVLVNFETEEGRSLILELNRSDKGFIPLGADVYDETNKLVGSVGQAGRAYVRGINDSGQLSVRWGVKSEDECFVSYDISKGSREIGLTSMLNNQICQMKR